MRPPRAPWRGLGEAGASMTEMVLVLALGGLITSAAVSTIGPTNQLATEAIEATENQDGARSAVHLLAATLRRVPSGGVLIATSDSVVVAMPVAMGVFCASTNNYLTVYLGLGGRPLVPAVVDGYGFQNADGTWALTVYAGTTMFQGSTTGRTPCVNQGGGVAGDNADYITFNTSTSGLVGAPFMIWDRQTFRFGPSALVPTTRGFHYGSTGTPLVELAYGLHAQSRFQYRLRNTTTWVTAVSSSQVALIDAVRVMAAGSTETSATNMMRDIPLMNTDF